MAWDNAFVSRGTRKLFEELITRLDRSFDEFTARSDRSFEEFGQFNRDLLTRFDQSMSAIDRRLAAQTEVLLEMRQEVRENTATIREMRAEIRANTQAVLHVLDELRGPGTAQA